MKKHIKTILQTIKVAPTHLKTLLVLVSTAAVVSGAVAFAGWTPGRQMFDWNKPADQIGSTDGPRMNAFINTSTYGDERGFFDARRTDQTTGGDNYKDILPYVTQGSKEVVLRTYVHNGANNETNGPNNTGIGVAKDAKVRIDLPTATETALRARSYITISNPAPGYPGEVTDTAEMVDTLPFSVQYIPGSAIMYNGAHPGGYKLSDSIVTSGAKVGYETDNGILPGCFEFQAMVEIRVKVLTAQPQITKQVRKAGSTTYGETTTVKPGDKVQWLIGFKNAGQEDLDNVAIRDQLPPHLKVVPNSVRWIYRDTNGTDKDVVQTDGSIFGSSQLTFGTWKPNGGFFLRFDTTALSDFDSCEVRLRNIVLLRTTQTPKDITDSADVIIEKSNCDRDRDRSSFDCTSLSKVDINRTTSRFTAAGTANKTTITGYVFKVDGVTKQDNASNTYTLEESRPGTYTVTVQVKSGAGTTDVKNVCSQAVEVKPASTSPAVSCDALDADVLPGSRVVRFTARVTADGGAKPTRYFYTFGDGTPELITDKAVVEYDYKKEGAFGARVKVEFALNATDKVIKEGPQCSKNFTIPPVVKPTVLPNTGAGPAEIFATTTAISTAAYYGAAIRRRK